MIERAKPWPATFLKLSRGITGLVLFLVAVTVFMTAAKFRLSHGISINGSKEQIRTSLLNITPLGIPIQEAKIRIQAQIHPQTFYYYVHAGPLPGKSLGGSKTIWEQWPLGGEHHGKEILSLIGQGGPDGDDIGAYWVFDGHDQLADIFVYDSPDAL